MCSRDPSSGGTSRARRPRNTSRIRRHAIHVDDPPEASGLTRDPADDYLVSLGRQGNVDAIISLDLDLLEAGLADPPAWTPRQLVEMLSKG